MTLLGRKAFYGWNQFLLTVAARGMCVSDPMQNAIGPAELAFLRRFARLSSPTVFDVGANIGQYAVALKKRCPGARIWAFEPHPASYKRLALSANDLGFTAVNMGLSDRSERRNLYDYSASPGSPHASLHRDVIETLHGSASASTEIDLTTIDELLASGEPRRLDLLKIDAEGHELAILRGATNSIRAGRIDIIQFEFNEMNVMNRVFLYDFIQVLEEFSLYRMVMDGLVPLGRYRVRTHELFFGHNIVAIRNGVSYARTLL